jgi:hypothetical protein
MSGAGSSAQFGNYVQPSLGEDFDRYAGQMYAAGSRKTMGEDHGPGEGYEVSVSTSPVKAAQVAVSGEIRNGFHPDARLLGGMGGPYEENRRAAEESLFGIPEDADHTKRPVYGYLRHKDHPGPYGDVVFDVHPGNRRVTTTPGDSLNNFSRVMDEGEDETSFYPDVDVERLSSHHDAYDHNDFDGYREVQIHGGSIPKKNIKHASVYDMDFDQDQREKPLSGTWDAIRNLRSAGIPTRVMGYMEHQPTLDREMFGKGRTGYVDLEAHGSTKYPRARPQ